MTKGTAFAERWQFCFSDESVSGNAKVGATRWPVFNRRPEGYDATDIAALVVRKTEALERQCIEDILPGEILLPALFVVAECGDSRP
jgi:hypothetical protein